MMGITVLFIGLVCFAVYFVKKKNRVGEVIAIVGSCVLVLAVLTEIDECERWLAEANRLRDDIVLLENVSDVLHKTEEGFNLSYDVANLVGEKRTLLNSKETSLRAFDWKVSPVKFLRLVDLGEYK